MINNEILNYLKNYDGPEMNIMEVCGSHTAAIAKNGIPGLLSPKIHLISGPGCPVCVTPSAYIDRCILLAHAPDNCIVTFGDLIRVPGSEKNLSIAKGEGARVEMVYSPMDVLSLAEKEPGTTFIFAAVGFETTAPAYALLMDTIVKEKINNIKLLTAIKSMPEVIDYVCMSGSGINAFIAPGHVSVVTGYNIFEPLAEKYSIPFGVSGFNGEEIVNALYGIVKAHGRGIVMNFYPSVVTKEGNIKALMLIDKYFRKSPAVWRGMGEINNSGMLLRTEYRKYDAGSEGLSDDVKVNKACKCADVLVGKIRPHDCPLFGKICTPETPQGACMVSTEGSCFSYLINHRED